VPCDQAAGAVLLQNSGEGDYLSTEGIGGNVAHAGMVQQVDRGLAVHLCCCVLNGGQGSFNFVPIRPRVPGPNLTPNRV